MRRRLDRYRFDGHIVQYSSLVLEDVFLMSDRQYLRIIKEKRLIVFSKIIIIFRTS